MKRYYLIIAMLGMSSALFGQSPTDLEFLPAGNICVGANYSYDSWDKYWEGDNLQENGNVGTVTTQAITAGFNLGIVDRLTFNLMVPYVFTSASQGTLNGQNGFQDLYLNLKAKYAEWTMGPGKLKLGGNVGFSTPISSYLVDFAPLNIGYGTTNLSYRQMISYKLEKGFYFDGRANYTYRSNVPDIHRDFYFDDNEAYYSNEVEVPNVFDWAVAAGFSNDKFLAEVSWMSSYCLGGTDIRTWDPGFPTNNEDASTINGRFDYYFSKPHGLNTSIRVGYVVAGLNTGQSIYGSIGINYLFPVWGKKQVEDKPVE